MILYYRTLVFFKSDDYISNDLLSFVFRIFKFYQGVEHMIVYALAGLLFIYTELKMTCIAVLEKGINFHGYGI